ncbi:hypothetical protein SARC_09931 [Sphaeroforma arctica JP610]|uniref:Uncharacterized protein n=1 Tax=Sphaeroforma arctica JP610 TaxID=667725 RepID=A0A0L0FLI6_9EUKA|nr:hypothetical protein SARC_09931 [Sphaeroforma arctica JP610]KNC77610.1 hypothetical protein SARC_09931 [Sphaeroforma arctica JP610]|eukprot:XP_014151512.1 hypothetical protein SARC_09931 [Sphaeroforma arctica JP610]
MTQDLSNDQSKDTQTLAATIQALTSAVVHLQQSVDRLEKRLSDEDERDLNKRESKSTARFYSFHQNFIAGSVALPLSFAVTHPLDTIKTRMQARHTGTPANGANGTGSFWNQIKSSFKSGGATRALGKGFLPSVLGAAPQGGLRLAVYGTVQNKLHPYFDLPMFQNAIAAVAGDVSSSVVKVPREIIVQRLQTGLYTSTAHAVRSIFAEEGMRGFFAGYWSTAIRDIPFMIILFTSYEQFKTWKLRFTTTSSRQGLEEDREWSDLETVLWGGVSGGLAGFSTTPFDVIKTRIMTETTAGDGRKMKVVLNSILKEDGLRGLFIGAGARSTWWFCVCSVFFYTFERVRTHVHNTFSEDFNSLNRYNSSKQADGTRAATLL